MAHEGSMSPEMAAIATVHSTAEPEYRSLVFVYSTPSLEP